MKIALTLTKREITSAVNNKYLEYVHNAGMQPIAFDQSTPTESVAEMCDGLLLKGGSDVDPIYYGYGNSSSIDIDPELDGFERQLFWQFLERRKSVFGICRGFQLIYREMALSLTAENRIHGFKFVQHLDGHNQAHREVKRPYAFHYVDYTPKLYDIESVERDKYFKPVNSMHHQGVQRDTGKNSKKFSHDQSPILPVAWASNVLEAFIGKELPVLAVQWHPEEMNDVALLVNIFRRNEDRNIADVLAEELAGEI